MFILVSCLFFKVEKKQLLIQQETDKLREREEAFAKELQNWKTQLTDRKKVRKCNKGKIVCVCFVHSLRHDCV